MRAPNDIMKSTYSLPSASHTCDPWPRSNTIGPAVYTVAPREGEFTPSTSDCWARSNHWWERVRLRVWLLRVVCIEFISEIRFAPELQSASPPPSTTNAAPVMKEESSEARNNAAFAI